MMTAPCSPNRAATVLFPDPRPPVSPTFTSARAPCGSDAQRPANFSRNAASASSVARVPLFSAASDE
jgi:hypothetical protein